MAKAKKTTKEISGVMDFRAAAYLPSDIFEGSPNIPSITEGESEKRIEHIKGQARAVEVAKENFKVAEKLHQAEEGASKAEFARVKADTGWSKFREAEILFQTQELKTLTTAQQKIQAQDRLDFDSGETVFLKQVLDLKTEGMQVDLQHATDLLELKRQTFANELTVSRQRLSERFERLIETA